MQAKTAPAKPAEAVAKEDAKKKAKKKPGTKR
jgi:hypothetical protein